MWVSLRAVETDDGWERKVKILGPAESGNAGEMRVEFADGTIDDWDVEEFVIPDKDDKEEERKWEKGQLVDSVSQSCCYRRV